MGYKILFTALALAMGTTSLSTATQNANGKAGAASFSPVVYAPVQERDMASKITGRTYHVSIFRPADSVPPPPEGFPVVYLTDADYIFHTAAEALAMQSYGLQAKPAIIVGIGYGQGLAVATRDRFADLTPSQPDAAHAAMFRGGPYFDGASYGGAEPFYRFLTEELRPQIDAAYKTDRNDNILWGHSLGGLFGLHVLFNHPEAFHTYLIGSPTFIWNGGEVLKDEPRLAAALAAGKIAPRVLLTAGSLEESVEKDAKIPPGYTREQLEAKLKVAATVSNVTALGRRLKAIKAPPGYQVETVVFDGETHISVMPAIISRGLRFALKP